MKFLVTRPAHDDTTFYLFKWSEILVKFAKAKGITILDLKKERVIRKNVETMINSESPDLVMFNGHGSASTIHGHRDEILIEKGKNDKILKNKIVYALSCNTASALGKNCVKEGTKAYIGYKEEFMFWISDSKSLKPLQDSIANHFAEPSNQVVHSLLKGATAENAYKRSQEVFDSNIEKLLRDNSPSEAQYILPLLIWDKVNQVVLEPEESKT